MLERNESATKYGGGAGILLKIKKKSMKPKQNAEI